MSVDDAVTMLRRVFEGDARISALWLFGSVARGDARPDSDIDLAYVAASEEARDSFRSDRFTLMGRVAQAFSRDAHLVDLEAADMTLRMQVFDAGRAVFDRDEARTHRLVEKTLRERFDWEFARAQHEAYLDRRFKVDRVYRAVLAAKCDAIVHHVGRLRARAPLDVSMLEADEDQRNIVLMDLQQAVQAVIDLATHVCSHEGLGLPQGPASAFALLASHGVIPEDLSIRLSGAAGLRNIIVHRYGDLSMADVARVVERDLSDLEAFVTAIRRHTPRAL